jgi:hypothetical protein
MKTDHTIDAETLRELVDYRDGALYWSGDDVRKTSGPIGSRAGRLGRLQVHIGGVARYVHRLIWLHQHGEWPDGQIDHINGNPHDNRIENMRVVTPAQNSSNRRHKGISFDKRNYARPWRARIMLDGRSISLGYYDTEAEAMAEYQRAKRVYHQSYATGVGLQAA